MVIGEESALAALGVILGNIAGFSESLLHAIPQKVKPIGGNDAAQGDYTIIAPCLYLLLGN